MRGITLTIFVLGLIAPPTFAEDLRQRCSPVDLKKTLGPVRDQDNLDWCYAFTAADVLSQALRQEKKGVLGLTKDGFSRNDVSPIQMAHEVQKKHPSRNLVDSQSFAGGSVAEALKSALSRGQICTDQEMDSRGGSNSPGLRRLQERADTERDESADSLTTFNRKLSEDEIKRYCRRAIDEFAITSVKDPVRSRYNQKKRPAAEEAKVNQQMREALDSALNQGRIAGIGYDSFFKKPAGAHASSIIGRRIINGECHYRIRNSWGLSCKGYDAPYDKQCQMGEIWVKEKELLPHVFSVDYIPASDPRAREWQRTTDEVNDKTYGRD
ncbi:MAG: hypothetical protein KF767_15960 [Bdellovibrionaceae bacterium]|nr:hypothetical protein [Pseudobdellovibrionaceae bacterium]